LRNERSCEKVEPQGRVATIIVKVRVQCLVKPFVHSRQSSTAHPFHNFVEAFVDTAASVCEDLRELHVPVLIRSSALTP